ncbi:uncharacterized protein YcnI [Allocatelliglobosispora scoriae]|uniref:Uncharacterized protein YcnI n=1 Tax=Allocatelliglobosispora scoriae TaxID=643052 RepID=A0A841C3A6_9ACTN|nr:YcnI family protein [Allocatelliglobosispora scoriae]MBB5874386.1 uncharacterized protein YcnI [Allocatelliglobosispora scoriae]
MRKTSMWRLATVVTGAAALVALVAGPASAHVTVNPGSATQGGYTKLTFRVPNEKADASTTKVEVVVPTDTPIASVSVKPVAGWTIVTERSKLPAPVKDDDGGEITEAVSKITWTATADAAIKPGQFQEFDISAGPLPSVDQIAFKALQTYSDGDVVRWIDIAAGGTEVEHPAPILKLVPKAAASAAATAPADDDSGSSLPLWLSIAALAVAVTALALATRRQQTA